MLRISLAGEEIANLGGFPITNSLFTTWLVMGFLLVVGLFYSRSYAAPYSTFRSVVDSMLLPIHGMFESIVGDKIRVFFPILATIFLFVIFSNWSGLLPGNMGSVGVKEKEESLVVAESHEEKLIPLFRAPTADLNTTLALALVTMIAIQYYGVKFIGPKLYIGKFITFKDPISFFVGILELISEFSRLISFSFRLFGNIFAGEVLLTVIAFLIPIIAPLPFLGLEIFVGFIQALVFSMLAAVFLSLAVAKAEH